MSQQQCRNGAACSRPDCWFAHPDGRMIGGSGGGGGYAPPSRSAGPSYGHGGGGGGGGGAANPGNVCRFGRQCHREGCYYQHPEGRDVDDGAPPAGGISAGPGARRQAPVSPRADQFNPEDWEDGGDDEAEIGQALAAEQCECCGGRPMECQTPMCKSAGRCACMAGEVADDEEDESLKDEWFPEFRNCPCCAGTIYRCQKQQSDCNSGNCFCSLQKGKAQQ